MRSSPFVASSYQPPSADFLALAAQPASAQLAGSEIHIGVGGPLTTGSATFGVEMRQAVDLAVAEANASGGILGAKIVADAADDVGQQSARRERRQRLLRSTVDCSG